MNITFKDFLLWQKCYWIGNQVTKFNVLVKRGDPNFSFSSDSQTQPLFASLAHSPVRQLSVISKIKLVFYLFHMQRWYGCRAVGKV